VPTPLRYVHDDFKARPAEGNPVQIVEVTGRTLRGRYLLRPDNEATALILGVIGRAQESYDVAIYGLHVMSNHVGLLIGVESATQQDRFVNYVMGNVAKEIIHVREWDSTVWARRNRPINVIDEAAQVERLRYCLGNSTREQLVEHPAEWPGAHSAKAHCRGEALIGKWVRRSELGYARRKDPNTPEEDFTDEYEVRLSKLPALSHLDDDAYAAYIREMCDELAVEAAAERRRTGRRRVLGPGHCARVDPLFVPEKVATSPAPLVHASTKELRKRYRKAYRAFSTAYRAAVDLLQQGLEALFPEGGILPTRFWAQASAPAEGGG